VIKRRISSREVETHDEMVALADEMLTIVGAEHMERDLADYHRILMGAFANLFRDFARATRHGQAAVEFEQGMGDTDTPFYRELVEDLAVLEEASEIADWLNTD